jgi:hypothetical protein
MIIALAERLDLDIRIDGEDDGEEEGSVFGVEMEEKRLEQLRKSASSEGVLPQGFITEEMSSDMQSLPEVSLLEKPMQEKEETPEPALEQPSLMAQPEGQ